MGHRKVKEKEFYALLEARTFDELVIEGIATGKFRLVAKVEGDLVHSRDLEGNIKSYNKIEQVVEWLKRRFNIHTVTLDFYHWSPPNN